MISVSDGSVQGSHLLRGFFRLLCFPHHLKKFHVQVAPGPLPTPHSSPRPGRSPDVGRPPLRGRYGRRLAGSLISASCTSVDRDIVLKLAIVLLSGSRLLVPTVMEGGGHFRPVSYTHLRAHETDSYLV